MLDMVAFFERRAGTVALQNTAGLADTHVTVLADNITVPVQCNKILGAYSQSQTTVAAVPTSAVVLSSPTLRATSLLELAAWADLGVIGVATEIPPVDAPYNDYKESPIPLQPGESLQCLSSTQAAAVAEDSHTLVFLTDGVLAMPFQGRIETVIADAAAAAVIDMWSPTAVVFRQALRAGTYALVGMKATGQSMVAARLVFGNQGPRPGVVANARGAANVGGFMQVDQAKGLFRYGRLGVWGSFTHTNPPVVEVLCTVADAAATMHFAFDVIKVA